MTKKIDWSHMGNIRPFALDGRRAAADTARMFNIPNTPELDDVLRWAREDAAAKWRPFDASQSADPVPETVYHAPSDMFVTLLSVDSKSLATIDHPYLGVVNVRCDTLRERY